MDNNTETIRPGTATIAEIVADRKARQQAFVLDTINFWDTVDLPLDINPK